MFSSQQAEDLDHGWQFHMDDNSIDHGFQCSDPISCLLLLGCLDPTTIHRRDTSSCKSLCLWPGRCQKWTTRKMQDAMHVDWSSTYNKFHTWTDSPFPCSNNPPLHHVMSQRSPSNISCTPRSPPPFMKCNRATVMPELAFSRTFCVSWLTLAITWSNHMKAVSEMELCTQTWEE